jgi:hypothetical protein
LDNEPTLAAKYAMNCHKIKMCCETTQILHTALRHVGLKERWLYKQFNPKHPSCIWTMQSRQNFLWLIEHGIALCKEYTFCYKKIHKCEEMIIKAKKYSHLIVDIPETPQLLAMPDKFRTNDPVHSYRLYYAGAKANMKRAGWKYPAEEPYWWNNYRKYVIDNNLEVENDKNDGIVIEENKE